MARSMTSFSTLCHKLLPVATLLALVLLASLGQQTIAQNADASASSISSSSGSSSSGSGSGGGIIGAATGAIAGGTTGAKAGSEAGSSGAAQVSGSIGGVSGSLSLGGGGASAGGSASSGSDSSSGSSASASASASGSSSGSSSGSASGSAPGSSSGSSSMSGSGSGSASASASASASVSFTSTPKPEGLFNKMKEIVKSGVDSLTHDDKKDNSMAQSGSAAQTSGSLGSGSESGASARVSASANSGGGGGGGLISKLKEGAKEMKDEVKSVFSGGEQSSSRSASVSGGAKIGTSNSDVKIGVSAQMNGAGSSNSGDKNEGTLSKLAHKVENKASEIGDKIKKPFQEGQQSVKASVNVQGEAEESLAVQVLDKSHQTMKEPLVKALRPLDKALGVKEDPLLKMYDVGHEKLRQPLALVSKPVESVFSGAFKTSDEARREAERSGNEMDRREVRARDEKLQKQGRSILGEITDRSVELAEKPFEIILRPVDKLLGFDKEGKKNPLIQLFDELYGFSKKPIDSVAKPFENILKKMADGDYQMSIRFKGDSNDPKLFTRLADGALNIADRVVTRPIEFAMRPLGYGHDRNNPIVDATHSLKNATKLGVELFTRPIDRIIKEIAEIGSIKDEQQREAEMQRKRQQASRIVHALDKIHEISQTPWEIVLRPVGKMLGYNKEGRKEPLLRAWDVVHQVVRTPIQVLSKPWEDALLGETQRAKQAAQQPPKVQAQASVRVGQASHEKKNFFTDQIRKVEKLATKPFDAITSPIRRLILGEDGRSGAKVNAKAQVGGMQAMVSASPGSNQGPDKIVRTIEQMNNVVLKPLEVLTQPISDMLSSEGKQQQQQQPQQQKGAHVQVSASTKSPGQGGQQARASGSISVGGMSASGSVKTG